MTAGKRRGLGRMLPWLAGMAMACGVAGAQSAAIISDGQVVLGIDDLAQLNVPGGVASVSGTTAVGVRYVPAGGSDQYEVTSHGCLCEGWGVAASGVSGYANNSAGTAGLTADSFASTATTATVVTSSANLRVTHEFVLSSATDLLYEVIVTIEALADVTDVEYRRTMDWDADPTPFSELVTIGGTAAASAVLDASNDGFSSSDPLSSICGNFGVGSCLQGDFVDSDFPFNFADHGANFDFGFGDLSLGETIDFSIFYGGADNVNAAFTAMNAAGIEVYSLGRALGDLDGDGFDDASGALTPTYIFGFSGVGGVIVPPGAPPVIPVPATLYLLGLGMIGAHLVSRRRKAA